MVIKKDVLVSFRKDLSEGHKAEERVLNKVREKYPKARRIEGYFKPYDIYVPERNIKLEVKYDKREKDTGYIFIEKTFNGEPSGIQTTTADYWITCLEDEQIWIKTSILRSIIGDLTDEVKTISFEVKGKTMTGYLIPSIILYASPYAIVFDS